MSLALRSNWSYADAYGLVASPLYDGDHLLIGIKADGFGATYTDPATGVGDGDRFNEDAWIAYTVTYDPADVQGTFAVTGRPGVIGLWLTTYSQTFLADAADRTPMGSLTLTDYTVTDLRPADNGYMFRRGFVWPPDGGALAKRPYP